MYLCNESAPNIFKCCHIETKVADQTCYLMKSQHADIQPTCHSTDPIMPRPWEGWFVGWLAACLMSQQNASVSQGWIC